MIVIIIVASHSGIIIICVLYRFRMCQIVQPKMLFDCVSIYSVVNKKERREHLKTLDQWMKNKESEKRKKINERINDEQNWKKVQKKKLMIIKSGNKKKTTTIKHVSWL